MEPSCEEFKYLTEKCEENGGNKLESLTGECKENEENTQESLQEKFEENEENILMTRDISNGDRCWEMARDDKYGRHLLANRDVEAGEVILTERPLVSGPNNGNQVVVCVGCNRHSPTPSCCPSCLLPLCSPSCPHVASLHGVLECPIFSRNRERFDFRNVDGSFCLEKIPYSPLLVLRVLLLMDKCPTFRRDFSVLEPLLDQWRECEGWLEIHQDVTETIREKLGLKMFQTEEILKVTAACCTNTFSKFLEPQEGITIGTKMRVCYLLAAIMSHSCQPNCEQAIGSQANGTVITVRATKPIAKGDQITISYTELLAPTITRRLDLLTNKLFICTCPRCNDPSDLGTMTSAMRCGVCLKNNTDSPGYVLPTPTNPDQWQCRRCSRKFSAISISTMVLRITTEMDSLLDNPSVGVEGLEKFIKRFSRLLHPNHGVLTRVKYNLCGQYGRMPGYRMTDLSLLQLNRKKDLCEEVLSLLETLLPGRTTRRGLILYELHISLLMIGRNNFDKEPKKSRKYFKKSLLCLKESLDILKDEPEETFAGDLYLGGKASLPEVEKFIKNYQN